MTRSAVDWGVGAPGLESRASALRAAWRRYLGRHPWQGVLTLTFDRNGQALAMGRSPERTDRAFRRLVQFANDALYGPRWMSRSPCGGLVWVRVQEAHGDGALHFHAVLLAPGRQLGAPLLTQMGSWWRGRYGLARCEVPRSSQAVVDYLIKHVGVPEQADVELSHNFRVIN